MCITEWKKGNSSRNSFWLNLHFKFWIQCQNCNTYHSPEYSSHLKNLTWTIELSVILLKQTSNLNSLILCLFIKLYQFYNNILNIVLLDIFSLPTRVIYSKISNKRLSFWNRGFILYCCFFWISQNSFKWISSYYGRSLWLL